MGIESITQQQLDELISMLKKVTNPGARPVTKRSHEQKNYRVIGTNETSFTLYLRQNSVMREDFSCGLSWNMPSGEVLTLVRYNGPSHQHPNILEREVLDFGCHIHRATQRYIDAGKKPESYAETTTRYSTLEGALHCLVEDCKISGIQTNPDHPSLFP